MERVPDPAAVTRPQGGRDRTSSNMLRKYCKKMECKSCKGVGGLVLNWAK